MKDLSSYKQLVSAKLDLETRSPPPGLGRFSQAPPYLLSLLNVYFGFSATTKADVALVLRMKHRKGQEGTGVVRSPPAVWTGL